MKIKLVRLRDPRLSYVLDFPLVECLGLEYIASYLRKNGNDVEFIDQEVQKWSDDEIIKKLSDNETGLIGFTVISALQFEPVYYLVKKLKKNGCKAHLTIGGQFATFMYKEILNLKEGFDSVVRYEGEITCEELANAIEKELPLSEIAGLAYKKNNKIIVNPNRELIKNLDDLPFPSRDHAECIVKNGGILAVASSRGCYMNCSFCSINQFYKDCPGSGFRMRSVENIIQEIEEIIKKQKITEIWFVDDNFITPGKDGLVRFAKLTNYLKKLKIRYDIYLRGDLISEDILRMFKDSGGRSIFIGVEAGTDYTLNKIFEKGSSIEKIKKAINLCKKIGVSYEPGFIMFHPWSTLKEIGENINFLKEIEGYTVFGIISFLVPYIFTKIGKEMIAGERRYISSKIKLCHIINDTVCYTIKDIKAEILLDLTFEVFEGFYKVPKILSYLKSRERILQLSNHVEESKKVAKYVDELIKRKDKKAMEFFENLYLFVKNTDLSEENKVFHFLDHMKDQVSFFCKNEEEKVGALNL